MVVLTLNVYLKCITVSSFPCITRYNDEEPNQIGIHADFLSLIHFINVMSSHFVDRFNLQVCNITLYYNTSLETYILIKIIYEVCNNVDKLLW